MAASHTVIYNEGLRKRFVSYLDAGELDMGHVLAYPAVEAAYTKGDEWLEQCLAYVQANIDYVEAYLQENLPAIQAMRPQASYLVWLDCRKLGLSQEALVDFFVSGARLALNDGAMFGKEGEGFMRMNVGCPRSILEQAMKQLKEAYDNLCR